MHQPLIVVIDGMGGGIGKRIVAQLTAEHIDLVALGTNPKATAEMMLSGAHEGHTGQRDMIALVEQADIVIGVMGILIPDGLGGEITPEMVLAICKSKAVKILVPMNRCGIQVAMERRTLGYHIDCAIEMAKEEIVRINHEG